MVPKAPASQLPISISLTLRLPHQPRLFVLEAGGTTIPPFHRSSHFLLDRNILSMLRKLSSQSERDDLLPEQWGLKLLDGDDVRFNPAMAALEGRTTQVPAGKDIMNEIQEVASLLNTHFPHIAVQLPPEDATDALNELLHEFARNIPRETDLLVEVGPLLADRVPSKYIGRVRGEILYLAQKHLVPTTELLVIAMLSCLYESASGSPPSPARGVLKPSAQVTPEDAYNALADLRALQLLAFMIQWTAGEAAILTGDRALAGFWDLLGIGKVDWSTRMATAHPKPGLFERLNQVETVVLLEELKAA